MRHAAAILFVLLYGSVAFADTVARQGDDIVIAPGAGTLPPAAATIFSPGDACMVPNPPIANDQAQISLYQAKRRRFIDCVDRQGRAVTPDQQHQLDLALGALQNDELEGPDEVQQDLRGVVRSGRR